MFTSMEGRSEGGQALLKSSDLNLKGQGSQTLKLELETPASSQRPEAGWTRAQDSSVLSKARH